MMQLVWPLAAAGPIKKSLEKELKKRVSTGLLTHTCGLDAEAAKYSQVF